MLSLPAASEVIGLLPAAGQATRIAPLPCSKEIYPLGNSTLGGSGSSRPKVACQFLLESMALAGVTKTFIVLRNGKWDIPAYLANAIVPNLGLAYLILNSSRSVPFTLNQAYPFVRQNLVAFGFPDIIFKPSDVFSPLISRQAETSVDVVLGLFPADRPQKMDMVETSDNGVVQSIVIKPAITELRMAWICAVWTPAFTEFMRDYLASKDEYEGESVRGSMGEELSVGHVLQASLSAGLRLGTVAFPDHSYLDIGTSEGLSNALQFTSL